MEQLSVSSDGKEIIVGTAVSFPKLTKVALDLGWMGSARLARTPGSVGGALKMKCWRSPGRDWRRRYKLCRVSLEGEQPSISGRRWL